MKYGTNRISASLFYIFFLVVSGCGVVEYDRGVPDAPDEAYEENLNDLRSAAHSGDADAQYRLGHKLRDGGGVVDHQEAIEWWSKAANQGHRDAQYNLGVLHAESNGGTSRAIEWWKRAAEQGDARAQYNLGMAYAMEVGVAHDPITAVDWWTQAAGQGDPQAEYNLGVAYARGFGVDQDLEKAAAWWKKAAIHGDSQAQYRLGMAYANGSGVEKNYVEAYAWLEALSREGVFSPGGDVSIAAQRNHLSREMSSEERAMGRKLSKQYYRMYVKQ